MANMPRRLTLIYHLAVMACAVYLFHACFTYLQEAWASRRWHTHSTEQKVASASTLELLTATAEDMQLSMVQGDVSCQDIVRKCLAQIDRYDGYLKGVLTVGPGAVRAAQRSDRDRRNGVDHGPLMGIPILVKDNIETGSDQKMDTTAGSYALVGAKSDGKPAVIVDRLLRAGAVILGKTQLSELAFYKGSTLPSGWSAVGGQCQSAYTSDDVQRDEGPLGHSSPGGSSTGSAVGVSAGYAPIAIGTDTTGSVTIPAVRASLYSLRFTTGSVSLDGVVPFSRTFDTLGVMAKSMTDIANTARVILEPSSTDHRWNVPALKRIQPWVNLRVGVLSPEKWSIPPGTAKPNPGAEKQLIDDTRAAFQKIKGLAKTFKEIELQSFESVYGGDGAFGIWDIFKSDFTSDMDAYLRGLKRSKVRNVPDIVEFNTLHADLELPEGYDTQDLLTASLDFQLSKHDRDVALASVRMNSTDLGIDKALKEYDLDVIIGSADCGYTMLVCAGGYPAATMPLSYLRFNNRPTAFFAVARRNEEATLLEVMHSWERTFPARQPPPLK